MNVIKCMICNKFFVNEQSLGSHIKYHELSSKDYYDKFLRKTGEENCRLEGCKNTTMFINRVRGYAKFCCNSHAQQDPDINFRKIANTNFKARNEKSKMTKIERYGDPHYNNRLKCQEKLLSRSQEEKNSWHKKVRDKWQLKSKEETKEIGQKRLKTAFKNNPDYIPAFMRKAIELGIENYSQIREVRDRAAKTMRDKPEEEKNRIKRKARETLLERYGVSSMHQIDGWTRNIVNKGIDTKLRNNKIIRDQSAFKKYKSRVYRLTDKWAKRRFSRYQLNKRKLCGEENGLQIDHIVSVKYGFQNKIPEEIISHPCNLRLVTWQENDSKKDKCYDGIENVIKNIKKCHKKGISFMDIKRVRNE